MFDVSWSDPERETVGQRKERKEREASGLQSSGSSIRSSKSSKSNDSQARQATRVSLLTFLNGSRKDAANNKKDGLGRSNSSSKQHARAPRPESDDSRRYSCFTEKTETSIQDSLQDDLSEPSTPKAVGDGYYMTAPDNHRHENRLSIQSSPTNDGSVFSARTGRSFATTTSWGSIIESSRKPSLVQPLSPKSFVTQTTEVTVSSTDSTHSHSGEEQVATYVHISSHGNHPIEVNRPSSRLSTSPAPFDGGNGHGSSETLSIAEEEALLEPSNWPNWKPPESWDNEDEQTLPALPTIPSHSALPSPTPVSPISSSSILQSYSSIPPLSPPPPSSPLPSLPRHSLSTSTKRSRRKATKPKDITISSNRSSELSHFQKSIRLKEAATPKIMLERLKEEWMVNADASMYRELELEKQLWMLTALRAENRDHELQDAAYEENALIESKSMTIASRPEKILSLYENHASASFLSAINPASELHHLSTSPLTPTHLPTTNLHPLYTPSNTPVLPYPPSTFTQIHSFPLSSGLLPSSSIPQVLHDIHRCLLNTGKLHLTIIDPSPSPSTTGPRLREWLETHLITNLERQFRCLNPSRLFPLWLSDAGLRAEGSTIQKVRFRAVVDGEGSDVGVGGECHGMGVGEELRSVVGRMLWREMWGSWVEGDRWWWECSEVVEECRRMGTAWEYFVIEAVKEP